MWWEPWLQSLTSCRRPILRVSARSALSWHDTVGSYRARLSSASLSDPRLFNSQAHIDPHVLPFIASCKLFRKTTAESKEPKYNKFIISWISTSVRLFQKKGKGKKRTLHYHDNLSRVFHMMSFTPVSYGLRGCSTVRVKQWRSTEGDRSLAEWLENQRCL